MHLQRQFVTWLVWVLAISAGFCHIPLTMAGSSNDAWSVYQSHEPGLVQQYALADPVSSNTSLTITSRIRLIHPQGEQGVHQRNLNDIDEIWLAGVAAEAHHSPVQLAIVWRLDASGMLPVWRFQLRSDDGLLPSPAGTQLNLPCSASPRWDTTYATLFAYNPSLGVVSLRVVDETHGQVLCTETLNVDPFSQPLFPGTGLQRLEAAQPAPILEVMEVVVVDRFVPINARAHLVSRKEPDDPFTRSTAIDRRDEVAVGIELPQTPLVEGYFSITIDDGGSQTELMRFAADPDVTFVPVNAKDLPVGDYDVVLHYELGDYLWELNRSRHSTGRIDVRIHEVELIVDENGQPKLTGRLSVSSDGALPEFRLALSHVTQIPGSIMPVNDQWQNVAGRVILPIVISEEGATSSGVSIPFTVPLELQANMAGQQLFVTFSATSDSHADMQFSGNKQFVLGDRIPAFPDVREYVVLRGDFHVHSSESFDSSIPPNERIWEAYMYGYDVVSLTDHGTHGAYDRGIDLATELGLILIRGMETGVTQRVPGIAGYGTDREHFVILGIDPSYQYRDEHRWSSIPGGSTVFYQDQIRRIVDHGGYVVYAHPGGGYVPPPPYEHELGEYGWTEVFDWMLNQGYVHGIEVRGNFSASRRDAAFQWALDYGLTMFDGTDIHEARDFNMSRRSPVTLVLANEASEEGIMDALRSGRTLLWRDGQLRGSEEWLRPFIEALLDFRVVDGDAGRCLQVSQLGSITLAGVARFEGSNANESFQALNLPPFGSRCFTWDEQTRSVEIQWSNVWTAPGRLLRTVHAVSN